VIVTINKKINGLISKAISGEPLIELLKLC